MEDFYSKSKEKTDLKQEEKKTEPENAQKS